MTTGALVGSLIGVVADPQVRLGICTEALLVMALTVRRDRVSLGEARMFRAVNGLPDASHTRAWAIMQLGSLGAAPVAAGWVRPRAHSAPPPIWRFPADRGTQRQGRHPDQLRYGPVGVTLLVPDALDRSALVADDSDVAADTDGNAVGLIGHITPWAEMTR